jgi:hypothetical protein
VTTEAEKALESIAPLMQDLEQDHAAAPFYDLPSAALVWRDEIPDFNALRKIRHWHVIRFVNRFRMTLILGQPDEELRQYWERAQQLFPTWPGFVPARRAHSLERVARELESDAIRRLDEDMKHTKV